MSALPVPQVAKDIISKIENFSSVLLLSESERKLALDLNFIGQLAQMNPDLQFSDFLDFIHKAQLTGADPRRGQIHLVTFRKNLARKGQADKWVTKAQAIFSYHFFISKAEASGNYDGHKVVTEVINHYDPWSGEERRTICATCTVFKKSGREEIYSARLPEFAKLNKDGNPTEAWLTKPYLMLEKCAIANALRKAFPDQLTGCYMREEIEDESSQTLEVISFSK
ncbi:MAG TPA: phage recombination protein Bet, partial [Methanosarcina sp.]|nr:phage recombination protein Bet [Methanosarcina sp.]